MFDSDQEDMVILYKFPKGLHCKALVDLPFSKTPDVDLDLDCESFVQPLYYYFSFVYYSNPAFLFVLEVMGKLIIIVQVLHQKEKCKSKNAMGMRLMELKLNQL